MRKPAPVEDRSVGASSRNYRFSANVQVIADADTRFVIATACPVPGTTADAKAWRDSGLAEHCQGVTMLGDGAYLNTGLIVPHRKCPELVLAGKAYSSRAIRGHLRHRGIRAVIPQPADQIAKRQRRGRSGGRPPPIDRDAHKQRNTVERRIDKLTDEAGYVSRTHLALGLLDQLAAHLGHVPVIVADAGYGRSISFRLAWKNGAGRMWWQSIAKEVARPATAEPYQPPYGGLGPPTRPCYRERARPLPVLVDTDEAGVGRRPDSSR